MVLKAILLLEIAGVQVLGTTSDGASTNRTMWNALGICTKFNGIQNLFTNPFQNKRRVFAFSDGPHLLKTVRNQLYTKRKLRVIISIYNIKHVFSKINLLSLSTYIIFF